MAAAAQWTSLMAVSSGSDQCRNARASVLPERESQQLVTMTAASSTGCPDDALPLRRRQVGPTGSSSKRRGNARASHAAAAGLCVRQLHVYPSSFSHCQSACSPTAAQRFHRIRVAESITHATYNRVVGQPGGYGECQ